MSPAEQNTYRICVMFSVWSSQKEGIDEVQPQHNVPSFGRAVTYQIDGGVLHFRCLFNVAEERIGEQSQSSIII